MQFLRMDQLDLNNKKVLIRVDLNVPLQNNKILNESRLLAILPTLSLALKQNARIILLSHLGRPKEGQYDVQFSLQPVAKRLSELLGKPIHIEKEWLKGVKVESKEIVLCENVRFNQGEEANEEGLAKKIAVLGDIFIMDAFASAHRAHASTVGVAKYAKVVAAGPLLIAELEALSLIMQQPKRPLAAVVGGAKVSDKLLLLNSLIEKVDILIVGGGIANTFIAALGYPIGSSLYEPNLVVVATELLQQAKKHGVNLSVPIDAIVAADKDSLKVRTSDFTDIQPQEKIFDVGPKTALQNQKLLKGAKTILWNGPLGMFEIKNFQQGTKNLAYAIAKSSAFSVAGGGETLAAIEQFNIADKVSYISTGGGAFLEFLEGKTLPAIAILEERAKSISVA